MVVTFESTTGPFYWYPQSHLILYDDRLFSSFRLNESILKLLDFYTHDPKVHKIKLRYMEDLDDICPPKQWLVAEFSRPPYDPPFLYLTFGSHRRELWPLRVTWDAQCVTQLYDHFTPRVKQLQRFARKRAQDRRLAFAMGGHARLGEGSLLCMLGEDMIQAILCHSATPSRKNARTITGDCPA